MSTTVPPEAGSAPAGNSPQLRRTALYEEHVRLGARLTDFGGWEMPLHYGSQIEEHHGVRRDAGMFDVSHMLTLDLRGCRRGRFCGSCSANDVEQADCARKGALLLPAARGRRRPRRPDRLFPRRKTGSGWWSMRAPPTRTWPGSCAARPPQSGAGGAAAARSRHARRAGTACPRAAFGKHGRKRALDTEATRGVSGGAVSASCSSLAPATPARTDSRLMLPRNAGRGTVAGLARWRGRALRAGRPRHVAAGSGNESLRAGHGRVRHPVRGRAGLDGGDAGRASVHRPRCAALAHAAFPDCSGWCCATRACCGRIKSCAACTGPARSPAEPSRLRWRRSIALARVPTACRPGERVEVEIRERWLQAEIVKYPFVRMGRSLLPA